MLRIFFAGLDLAWCRLIARPLPWDTRPGNVLPFSPEVYHTEGVKRVYVGSNAGWELQVSRTEFEALLRGADVWCGGGNDYRSNRGSRKPATYL